MSGLSVSWFVAEWLRLLVLPYTNHDLVQGEMFAFDPPLLLVLSIWLIAGLWTGALRLRYGRFHGLAPLAQSVVLSSCLLIVAGFVFQFFRLELSRLFILLIGPVSLGCIVVARSISAFITEWIDMQWPSPERVAVLGQSDEAWRVVNQIQNSGQHVSVAGLILSGNAAPPDNGRPLPVLGTTSALASVINHKRLDRIIILDGCATEDEVDKCNAISKRMGVVCTRAIKVPDHFVKLELVEGFGLPLLDVRTVAFTRRQELIKRCFDQVAALILIILGAPVFLLIALIVQLTSEGPILYKAPRVGRGGRHFTCLKFRSMYVDQVSRSGLIENNGKNGHIFKLRQDPRVTPWGRFLRKYSLDEFPQLLNVLRGDMSIVGPRPLPAEDLDPDGQSRDFESWAEGRSRVLPGITGLWQICGRSDVPFEKMIELDIKYIREWSLAVDLRILLKTPVVVITGKGAY
jgi:exopolysaccharide biosynthesis polyprenyl glycosylphosphotransferase